VLDLMRSAARTLEIEANGVTDNPLVLARSGERRVGRKFPRRAGRLRRRQLALALCEIGSILRAAHRDAVDPKMSGCPRSW
jgi:histidine ammonia-lyase